MSIAYITPRPDLTPEQCNQLGAELAAIVGDIIAVQDLRRGILPRPLWEQYADDPRNDCTEGRRKHVLPVMKRRVGNVALAKVVRISSDSGRAEIIGRLSAELILDVFFGRHG